MREEPGGGLPAGGVQSETSGGTDPHGSPLLKPSGQKIVLNISQSGSFCFIF